MTESFKPESFSFSWKFHVVISITTTPEFCLFYAIPPPPLTAAAIAPSPPHFHHYHLETITRITTITIYIIKIIYFSIHAGCRVLHRLHTFRHFPHALSYLPPPPLIARGDYCLFPATQHTLNSGNTARFSASPPDYSFVELSGWRREP